MINFNEIQIVAEMLNFMEGNEITLNSLKNRMRLPEN